LKPLLPLSFPNQQALRKPSVVVYKEPRAGASHDCCKVGESSKANGRKRPKDSLLLDDDAVDLGTGLFEILKSLSRCAPRQVYPIESALVENYSKDNDGYGKSRASIRCAQVHGRRTILPSSVVPLPVLYRFRCTVKRPEMLKAGFLQILEERIGAHARQENAIVWMDPFTNKGFQIASHGVPKKQPRKQVGFVAI
jgi:hypothetical protein